MVGSKVPDIVITDFISDNSKGIELSNKFKVLEFWATWCAPCLAAVPHINALQSEFSDKKNLVFLSITYETPEKVKRTLERINFETLVVSDQTKETHRNLGVEQYGFIAVPQTILLDDNNIIRWMGLPEELTADLLNDFINREEIAQNEEAEEMEENEPSTLSSILMNMINNKKVKDAFVITQSEEADQQSSMFALSIGKYFTFNSNLAPILATLSQLEEYQIILPAKLETEKFNLAYKSTNINPKNFNEELQKVEIQKIKSNVLSALKLTEKRITKETEVYRIEIMDKSKLVASNPEEMTTHVSSNDTHLVLQNISFDLLAKSISAQNNLIIINEKPVAHKFDFLLQITNNEQDLTKELANYGLLLVKTKQNIDYLVYE
jgi:thiol-disulfide isomerase/thioredoxin